MNINELKINESTSLNNINNINIDTKAFDTIKEHIKMAFNINSIDLEKMQIYYQRNNDATSILVIQVEKGDNQDMTNYMINGSKAWQQGETVYCDVYMHADKKCSKKAMEIGNLISRFIVEFFEEFEQELLKTNNFDISLSIAIPLYNKVENNNLNREYKYQPKEDSYIKKLIKKIIKNR